MVGINRKELESNFNKTVRVLNRKIECVFISYQNKDKEKAKKIADYILSAGIDVYFDQYDQDLKIEYQSTQPKRVTDALCKGIDTSSHMLVIVSPTTLQSKWVPFEIGYGYDKTDLAVLTLKGIPKGSLPEYLRTSTVIRDIDDLNKKISSIKGLDGEVLLERKEISSLKNVLNPIREVMDNILLDNY